MFSRTKQLIGEENLEKLKTKKILVIGLGGVGGFALESLVRSGISNITIIDKDKIDLSNLNRQIIAFHNNIGEDKSLAFYKRCKDINPDINIDYYTEFINKENMQKYITKSYDYVIDAIDNITSKLDLIEYAYKNNINIISSMGMGNKLTPENIKITDIYKTKNCPLAKIIRKELKLRDIKKLDVVYSSELPIKKLTPPASMIFAPATAGLLIGYYVIDKLINE